MTSENLNAQMQQALRQWFESVPGEMLLDAEQEQLRRVLPKMFGYYALQLGSHWPVDALMTSMITCKCVIGLKNYNEKCIIIKGLVDDLPVKSDSVDLLILPHVLEFAHDPHQILREADRVLIPEGHIIIFGFNPLSLWGAWRMLGRLRQKLPWTGQFISLTRIKDWLALLGFEIREKTVFFQRPPIKREGAIRKLQCLEQYGQYWLPTLGAVYMVVAEKKEIRLTPIKPRWRSRRPLVSRPPVVEGLERVTR